MNYPGGSALNLVYWKILVQTPTGPIWNLEGVYKKDGLVGLSGLEGKLLECAGAGCCPQSHREGLPKLGSRSALELQLCVTTLCELQSIFLIVGPYQGRTEGSV